MPKPDVILQTKLVIPQIQEGLIVRNKRLTLLKKNLQKKLIIICGNAGYGKTTLLVQLCGLLSNNLLFYTLESSDNDITTFFHYLVSGIQRSYSGFGKKTQRLLEQTPGMEMLVGTFINELVATVDKDYYIMLDDFHHVQTNKQIIAMVDYLLHHLPARVHLILATRATPPLNLSHYLSKQQLYIIETKSLRFDDDEIKKLLQGVYKLNVPDTEVQRVAAYSDGWITAIQLIMQQIAALGEESAKETLNGYVASGEELFDYFAREVFQHQTKKLQTFMLKTSFLERMEPSVCNTLLSIKTSRAMLKQLEREHLFISHMGNDIYKYHPLFQKFIHDVACKQFAQKSVNKLYRKIGDIYSHKGDNEAAIDYYLNGGHFTRALRYLKKNAQVFITSCRFNRLLHWIERFPDEVVERNLMLMNIKAEVLWHVMRLDESLDLLQRVVTLARKNKDRDSLFEALYGLARIQASSGKFTEVLKYLRKCQRIPSIVKKKMVDVYNLEGICYVYLNQFKKAERRFTQAANIQRKHGGLHQHSSLMNNLAIVAFTKGELENSLNMFKELARTTTNIVVQPHLYSNIALAQIDLGYVEDARSALVKTYQYSKRYTNTRGFLMFLLSLGFYYLELTDYKKATRYFTKLMKMSREVRERLSEHKAKHGLMKTLYLAGDTEGAKRMVNEIFEKDKLLLSIRNHDGYLLKGLIELQDNNAKRATRTLIASLKAVEGTEYKYSLMRNYYYLAEAYLATRKTKKANEFLAIALRMAKSHKYDYSLIRMGVQNMGLLEYAVKQGIQKKYVEGVIAKIIARSKINISLFGDMHITINGKKIEKQQWQTRKAQVVFAFLMLNRRRAIAKEELMQKFSSQEKPHLADQGIRTTISRIQKALGWKEIISYQQGFYRICELHNVRIDVEEFETLAKDAVKGEVLNDERSVRNAHHAITLYQGAFLSSCYEEWCDEMRRYLKELYIQLLQRLGTYQQAHGHYEEALHIFQKLLVPDPLNENSNIGVIKCLLALNRRSEALTHFGAYKKRLAEELSLTPSERVMVLLKQ